MMMLVDAVNVDARVLVFTVAVAVAAGRVFGVLPAI